MVKLIAQLPILQDASSADVDSKHSSENTHIPEGEPVPDVPGTEPHYLSSALRRTNPRPRTVWSSFTGNGSSSFFRIRAIWTSITLSSEV